MPATYRILHASDLHLSHVPCWYWDAKVQQRQRNPQWLKRTNNRLMDGHDDDVLAAFARFVHRYGPVGPGSANPLFDHVLLTGDLATTGFRNDLERAYRFLTEPSGTVVDWLDANSEPTIGFAASSIDAMPGNHDRYRQTRFSLPGGAEFDAVFNDHARPRQFWIAKQGVQRWQVFKSPAGRPLAVIAVDLTLRRSDLGAPPLYGFIGQGRAYQKRIQALEKEIQQVHADCAVQADQTGDENWKNPVVFWAVHFDVAAPHKLKLLESHRLLKAAERWKVPAILAGHTHASMVRPLSSTTVAYVCGTTTQAAARDPFDATRIANDCQLLVIDVPDATGDPVKVRVQWHRYQDPMASATTSSSPAGRFVRVAAP